MWGVQGVGDGLEACFMTMWAHPTPHTPLVGLACSHCHSASCCQGLVPHCRRPQGAARRKLGMRMVQTCSPPPKECIGAIG